MVNHLTGAPNHESSNQPKPDTTSPDRPFRVDKPPRRLTRSGSKRASNACNNIDFRVNGLYSTQGHECQIGQAPLRIVHNVALAVTGSSRSRTKQSVTADLPKVNASSFFCCLRFVWRGLIAPLAIRSHHTSPPLPSLVRYTQDESHQWDNLGPPRLCPV